MQIEITRNLKRFPIPHLMHNYEINQWSKYLLCWPEFEPQIVGVVIPEVPEATKLSTQAPPLTSVVKAGPAI